MGLSSAEVADRFWAAGLLQRGMVMEINGKWHIILGNTPCLVYASFLIEFTFISCDRPGNLTACYSGLASPRNGHGISRLPSRTQNR